MTALTTARQAEGLLAQTDQLADLLHGADLQRQVPTCPDWNLRELVEHIGCGHRAGLDLIRDGRTEPMFADPALIPVPADDELAAWLRAGARELADTVREAGAERPVWNYLGVDLHAGFWVRRMAHDTAVHRFDASLVVSQPYVLDADLAADAVSEWLMVVTSPGAAAFNPEAGAEMRGTGQTLHLHATDGEDGPDGDGGDQAGGGVGQAGGDWLIRRDPEGVSWRHGDDGGPGGLRGDGWGDGRGDVEVRGLASHLLLALLGRIPLDDDRLEILGDRTLIEHWVRHITF